MVLPYSHEPCVHLASPCSLFQSTMTSPDWSQTDLLPPLRCQQPHFGFKHQDTGSCGWRRGGGRDGPFLSPRLTAEYTAQRQNTARGPWPDYTLEAHSIHCASLDKWLCSSTFISHHFPSPWDTEHWWLTMEHCNALTSSMNRKVHPCKSLLSFWKHEITGTRNLFLKYLCTLFALIIQSFDHLMVLQIK